MTVCLQSCTTKPLEWDDFGFVVSTVAASTLAMSVLVQVQLLLVR